MHNIEIRQAIKAARLMQYEVAAAVGVSESTLCKWFRRELTDEQRERVLAAIDALKGGACG